MSLRSQVIQTPTAVLLHNGMENTKETQDSEKLVCTSATVVSKVQNGGVARHAKGSRGSRHSADSGTTSDSTETKDNVFDETASPFRSSLEMSPPVSPSTPTPPFIQKGAYISKELYGAAYSVVQELLNTERTYVKDLEVVTIVSSSSCFLFCFVFSFFVMVKNNQN
ncbi:PREDICTED: uncharacterized protein LOC107348764 [Acropora digitifera]|uniref:uncharacterized protein LOC107348764 n=1 Tax=Acropora digitifera TaxID=70779 RepID=UPI000779FED9|nr:PREDICTED: uncharacterized protein LOC107348764 [Acropora digitifera]